jgi:hypothetical protein
MKIKTKKKTVQQLLGLETFGKYGLIAGKAEYVVFSILPSNIAVMSLESVQIKIEKLMDLLTAFPNIQIFCTDGCECFDNNKIFISTRIDDEENNAVRELLTKDLEHMESIQSELSNSRQFYLVYRFRNQSKDLAGTIVSRLEKCMSEYDFVCKRLEKSDLKQFLAVYFGISSYGAEIADVEGATNENM